MKKEFPYDRPGTTLDEEVAGIWENLSRPDERYGKVMTLTAEGFGEICDHIAGWARKNPETGKARWRGKSVETGEWVYGHRDGDTIRVEVRPDTLHIMSPYKASVMEDGVVYPGHDIYEGDIIHAPYLDGTWMPAQRVEYDGDWWVATDYGDYLDLGTYLRCRPYTCITGNIVDGEDEFFENCGK
jgi:hypothetical protein